MESIDDAVELLENPNPQPKIFCYKVAFSDGRDTINVAVMAMAATDAKDGLSKMVPEGITIELEPITTCTMLVQF